MRKSLLLALILALSGCVAGRGCLLLQPVKHTLTGRIHFRSFPAADGIDNVPVLTLDRTAYLYVPAQSFQCLSATDLQLVGVAEFPENVIENSHVSVNGSLFTAASPREHTQFLMNVKMLLPVGKSP
ncbi:MAG: hypothetical protein NVSMB10_01320 [Steroidobacteraceae bacterium]